MSLPRWIDERIEKNLDNTLTQEHVVETMLEAERPFFSLEQLNARLKPDVSNATVRNRLKELQQLDVVATEHYPDSITLYYINHRESSWPLSPEGKAALITDSPLDRLSTRDFLMMRDTKGIRTLCLAGFQWTLILLAFGAILTVIGSDFGAESDIVLWDTAFDLLVLTLLVLFLERTIRWSRIRFGPIQFLPSPK